MPERRYSDDDVHRILALAAEAEATTAGAADRPWTLAEIQRVGAEAGLAPATVTAAALALDRLAWTQGERRYLGLPVAVARAVPLERPLSEEDWERLVARLRDTFAAQGRVQVTGARHEWRNGNLRVTHEPAGDGALLALRTRKSDARPLLNFGAALTLGSAAMAAALAAAGAEASGMAGAAFGGAVGLVTLVIGAVRLPMWAGARARQFESIAGLARRLSGS